MLYMDTKPDDHGGSARPVEEDGAREEVHLQIVSAQKELREARGRVLEATSPEQLHALVTLLARALRYIERARTICAESSSAGSEPQSRAEERPPLAPNSKGSR